MKALLMHPDRDLDISRPLPRHEPAVSQDLELNTLLDAMADGDPFVREVEHKILFASAENDLQAILYRQEILRDCLKNATQVRELYALATQTIEQKRSYSISVFRLYPSGTLYDGIKAMQFFIDVLGELRRFAETHANHFGSRGLNTLLTMLRRELDDEYVANIVTHLKQLRFNTGVLISAELAAGNQGASYVLRQPSGSPPSWFRRLLWRAFGGGPPGYTFRLHPRDESGARIVSDIRDRGINPVANAVAQSVDHIISFFQVLRTELAFYIGCLNLHDRLVASRIPIAFPRPAPHGTRERHFRGLQDICLALRMNRNLVPNDLGADGKNMVIITGANQGGKSSFLRAIGVAQLMMQSGMFVAAHAFSSELCKGLYSHYKREEDATMKSGKLDEELARVSDIVDAITPNSMLLFNESFASTNEREGSEIARQVACALIERGVLVFFVTHLYDFARRLFEADVGNILFLRADRKADGTRTFKLIEGEPLETSYGEDLYGRVFEAAK